MHRYIVTIARTDTRKRETITAHAPNPREAVKQVLRQLPPELARVTDAMACEAKRARD